MEGFLPAVRGPGGIQHVPRYSLAARLAAAHVRHAGSVQSQVPWRCQDRFIAQHSGAALTAKGIGVATLSDSYDACTDRITHAADDIASGDLRS